MPRLLNILLWHVHGSWLTAFLQGPHRYFIPVNEARDSDGRGRAHAGQWPQTAVEVTPERLRSIDLDVVILQRPHELSLVEQWTGRRPGRDIAAVYLEHNPPSGDACGTRHPMALQRRIPVVHVTHFNRMYWDCGIARCVVIEHGIIDPGYRYTGERAAAAVVMNDPIRRGRTLGTDLLEALSDVVPLFDVYGMNATELPAHLPHATLETHEVLPQDVMHGMIARCRMYLHTARWTSLGLSLLEAMHLGLPVVSVASTEVPRAVPPGAGVVSSDLGELASAVNDYLEEPEFAAMAGLRAREIAKARYGLERFLREWDSLLYMLTA